MMFPFRVFPRIYLAVAFVIGVVIFGSVGYVVVEGYSWVEALYMTVITVSTVGFGEVRELSDSGMVFTTVLIMGSLGTFAYSISALTTYFVNGEYRNTFKEARLKQEVEKLSDHVIVCGLGRVGDMAVQELVDHNTAVVVVENDPEKAEWLGSKGVLVISGDATRDENLADAGITRAKSVITTLPDDAQNLVRGSRRPGNGAQHSHHQPGFHVQLREQASRGRCQQRDHARQSGRRPHGLLGGHARCA